MLRRLNIAAGLLHDPKVVLMDEPTVGLDPQSRASILELVRSIAAGGSAVVYTTRYLDEAERLCDRIGIVDHGSILAEGTLQELRDAAGAREIIALRGTFAADEVAREMRKHAEFEVHSVTDTELLLASASLGILLGTLFKNPDKCATTAVWAAILLAPIGGLWWPLELVSPARRRLAYVVPTGWAGEGVNALLAFGASAWDVAPFALGFVALFAVSFPLAARRLQI